MADEPRDALQRLQAYRDFTVTLPGLGIKPTPEALWKHYVAENKKNQEEGNGKRVPTTTRSKVYQWCNEDRWRQRMVEDEQARQKAESEALLQERKTQLGQMSSMLPKANEALLWLIENTSDDATRLRAVVALYDRLGFVPESRTAVAKRRMEEDEAEAAPKLNLVPPDADAPDSEWTAYLNDIASQGG